MNILFDVLEICLQELENGADLEAVLARYPDLAGELRPILMASVQIQARSVSVSDPAPDVIRRGRAKLLQHASEMREGKVVPRKHMIPIFQRLAISFTLTALFLVSGTGLVGASSFALPGEKLYPIKLTWENLRLFFTFNEEYREALAHTFENERLHEINELLVEGRYETIQFAGAYREVNGIMYVSGIHIVILDTSILPAGSLLNGAAVEVTGRTNAEGFVDVESIKLLPEGTVVPPGQPVEVDVDHNSSNNNVNGNENINGDSNDNTKSINDNDGNESNSDDVSNDSSGNNNDSNNTNDSNANDDSNPNDSNSNDDSAGDDNNNDSESNSGSGGGGDDGNDNNDND